MSRPAWAGPGAPIPVEARVADRAYFVGQAIELQVGAVASRERPEAIPPRLADADVIATGTRFRQLAVDGIGDVVNETNLYLYSFRIIPRRSGPLLIPGLTVRLGDRSGLTRPIRLMIRDLPILGRPATFTGGVGDLKLDAEARPASNRLGQALEYRLRLIGPAARGASRPPDLREFGRPALGLRVEPLPAEVVADPPSRTFRYRIRPSRVGSIVLPPVRVAAFDPKSETYQTQVAPAVSIRVVDVPAFDPSRLDYGTVPDRSGTGRARGRNLVQVYLVLLGLVLVLISFQLRAWSERWRSDPRRRARRLAIFYEMKPKCGAREAGRLVTDSLAEFLNRVSARPLGALTPVEAIQGIEAVTDDRVLAERAGRLVAECDRAWFAVPGSRAEDLAVMARDFFRDLARARFKIAGKPKGGKTERGTLDRAM